ncbi:hypothetical protein AAOGI_21520 [Agarivorans albus]
MIFAELEYSDHYNEMHAPIVEFIKSKFDDVKSGHQCDSWIWVFSDGHKVAIDTFSSMKHQVKSEVTENPLINKVIEALQQKYKVSVYQLPELEAHE